MNSSLYEVHDTNVPMSNEMHYESYVYVSMIQGICII